MKPKTIIISPSGKFYGSEQVLFDFLVNTEIGCCVFVPKKSEFYNKLIQDKITVKHSIKVFDSNKIFTLYLKIAWLLLVHRFDKIYINEGGHIKWIKKLAEIFKSKKYFIHLRIIEDVDSRRLGNINSNIHLITISNFMKSKLLEKYNCSLIYDPYDFDKKGIVIDSDNIDVLKLGIVGRVSITKGIKEIRDLLKKVNTRNRAKDFEFHFFGDIMQEEEVLNIVNEIKEISNINVFFHGFQSKSKLYSSVHAILHFNRLEPLGRIFFEAVSYELPFIGFDTGGIGELAKGVGMNETIITDKEGDNWIEETLTYLESIKDNYGNHQSQMKKYKRIAKEKYSINKYVSSVNELIN